MNSLLSNVNSSSTDNSRAYGLSGQISNIAAVNSSKGGRRRRKRKSRKGSRKSRKNKTRRYKGGGCTNCQHGGLSSVTNINNGYSTGSVQLPWNQSALANPPPYSQNLSSSKFE
jgi:hypothetical protein